MSAAVTDADRSPHDTLDAAEPSSPGKSKRRSFFGLGRKKRDSKGSDNTLASPKNVNETAPQVPEQANVPSMNISVPSRAPDPPRAQTPKSPVRSLHSSNSPILTPRSTSSPYTSPSPHRLSTSSSQIFERSVQEHPANPQTSPAIPAHIQTENHIPPVLSSFLAIADRDCDPDEVEIVMHSAHQPAVSVVAPSVSNCPPHAYSSLDHSEDANGCSGEDLSSHGTEIGAASATDKQRLSFISFADVVQAEQSQQFGDNTSSSRGSPVQSALDPVAMSARRSPSPIRLGSSPSQISYMLSERSPGSPGRSADNLGVERGELTIETMRQALRKTGSGDLGQRSSIGGSNAPGRTAS